MCVPNKRKSHTVLPRSSIDQWPALQVDNSTVQ